MKRGGGRRDRGGGGGGGGGGSYLHDRPPFDTGRRDSDASLCSSRPSSAGSRPSVLLTDRSAQSAALRSVNAYLSSHSAPVSLKPPLPSARDITEALRFVLSRLDWSPLSDLDTDLPLVLRSLGCPLKLNKSALRAPGTPHSFPPLLSAIHWLVQLAAYTDHRSSSNSSPSSPSSVAPRNDILHYVVTSYSLFLSANDDAVAELDDEFALKTQRHTDATADSLAALEREAAGLEDRLRTLKAAPSPCQALEAERALLAADVKKFEQVVEVWGAKATTMEARLAERRKELEAKEAEVRRLRANNAELKERIDKQDVSAREAERMRRELQALERDIAEAESGRNAAEDKAWELESDAGRKFKEIEVLATQCNQAIRKLKLVKDFLFVPNAEGSSPAEVMGIDYKTTLKPALSTLAEDTNKTSVSKLEELTALQNKSLKYVTVMEDKQKCLADLQAKCEEAEVRLSMLKKEIEDHTSKSAAEAEKIRDEFTRKEQNLVILEKEAVNFLRMSEQKLHDAVRESDEETQVYARELLAIIDAVSEYKEYMESTINGMKKDISETALVVAEAHKAFVSTKLVSSSINLDELISSGLNLHGQKRPRCSQK